MKQYRIGLMVGNKTIDYPHSVRMGVQNTLEDAHHLLVPIADLVPYHTRFNAEAYFRVAFEIASRLELDALIVPAGVITGYLSGNDEMMRHFLSTMAPSKTLVLERDIPGYRCITKDNAPGMHECMKHLIETCGFKEIAFISGPEASQGARERESVYFEEMEAHGLPVRPELFARGLFSGDCQDVVEKILDENPHLEAIACACDFIAYTVYHVLRDRKLAVGSDIAVTGFDDHAKSAHVDPPLSTVHMTGYDLGCMAAREAIRLCEGQKQQEKVISSRFVIRNSCGEEEQMGVSYFKELLHQKPFPIDQIVDVLMDATMSMADKQTVADFREQMKGFLFKIQQSYLSYCKDRNPDIKLFSSQDLNTLFAQDYREHLSLEGFHDIAIKLLDALSEEMPKEDANWIIVQVSYLHLRIARLLSNVQQDDLLAMNKREWNTFHMADDALREDHRPKEAYKAILEEFDKLGARYAELFLFPDSETFIGAKSFALVDQVIPIGYMHEGKVVMAKGRREVNLKDVLSLSLQHAGGMRNCTVGGVMAGNELMGVAVLDSGSLDDNGQLMAFLNVGFALKHMQMISFERETNELLHKSNVQLTRQSMQDEMTGLLNRRGFMDATERALSSSTGSRASIVYLDLDGLKRINDTYGHDTGDDAIRMTARLLEESLPKNGILGRLGGDEFIAYLPVLQDTELDDFCNCVQNAAKHYNEEHDKPYTISISYGGVCFDVAEGIHSRTTELMIEADERLYQMKRERKGSRRFAMEMAR